MRTLFSFLGRTLFSIVFLGGIIFLNASFVLAQTVPCPNGTVKAGVCFPTGTGLSDQPIADLLMSLTSWVLGIFGFLGIIAFVISGFQYLTATGDETQAETAKRNMQYSIIGIIVALSGWIIINAIDSALRGSPFF